MTSKRPSENEATLVQDDHAPISVDEAVARYPGEWMLLRVTARDQAGVPAGGVPVVHGPTRESVQQATLDALRARTDPAEEYYLFSGYRRVRSGEVWQVVLANAARGGGRVGKRKR